MTTGEKVRSARKLAGLKQAELATAISVTERAVRFWEAGTRKPKFEHVVAIARVTGQPLDYFTEEAIA